MNLDGFYRRIFLIVRCFQLPIIMFSLSLSSCVTYATNSEAGARKAYADSLREEEKFVKQAEFEDEIENAKDALAAKIYNFSKKYAAGPESAEAIGHAVTSECSKEISNLVTLMADDLKAKLSAPDSFENRKRVHDLQQKWTREFRETTWRNSVKLVVEIRTEAAIPK